MMEYGRSIMGALTVLSLGFGGIASADTDAPLFSNQQKQNIQQIVESYLLENPEILLKMSQKLQAQQQEEMQKAVVAVIPSVSDKLFHNNLDPEIGNSSGDVTLVEFSDFQCPHCKHMNPVIEGLIDKDKNLRVVYKHIPIFGENSIYAVKAAFAAAKQGKYLQLRNALMEASGPLTPEKVLESAKTVGLNIDQLKKAMESTEVSKQLAEVQSLAQKLKLSGTPAYVIAATDYSDKNNKVFFIPGGTTAEVISQMESEIRNQ